MSKAQKKSEPQDIQAEMVDETLVISVMGGDQPGVWRLQMPKTAAVFFEIAKDKDSHALLMREGKSKKQEITRFKDANDAKQALSQVTKALMGGGVRSVSAPAPSVAEEVSLSAVTVSAQRAGEEGLSAVRGAASGDAGSDAGQTKAVEGKKRTFGQKMVWVVFFLLVISVFTLMRLNSQLTQQTVSVAPAQMGVPMSADDLFGQ